MIIRQDILVMPLYSGWTQIIQYIYKDSPTCKKISCVKMNIQAEYYITIEFYTWQHTYTHTHKGQNEATTKFKSQGYSFVSQEG